MKTKEIEAFSTKTKQGAENFILTNSKLLRDSFHIVAFPEGARVSIDGKKITRGKLFRTGNTVTLCAEDPAKIKGKVLEKLNSQFDGVCTLKVAALDGWDDRPKPPPNVKPTQPPPPIRPTQPLPPAAAPGDRADYGTAIPVDDDGAAAPSGGRADYGTAIPADDDSAAAPRDRLVAITLRKLTPAIKALGPKGQAAARPELAAISRALDANAYDGATAERLIKSLARRLADGEFARLDPPPQTTPTQPLPAAGAAASRADYGTAIPVDDDTGGTDGPDYNTSSTGPAAATDGPDYNTSSAGPAAATDGPDYNTSSAGETDGPDYNTSSAGETDGEARQRLRATLLQDLAPKVRALPEGAQKAAAPEIMAAARALDLKTYDRAAAERLLTSIRDKLDAGAYGATPGADG